MKKIIAILICLLPMLAMAADTYYGTSDTTGSVANYGNLYGYKRGLKITPSVQITADSIYVLLRKSGISTGHVMAAIMRSADSSRVDYSGAIEVTAANDKYWLAIPMNGVTLKADTSYFICATADSLVSVYRLTSGGAKTTMYKVEAWDGVWDNPETGFTSTTSGELWIYVAGTAGEACAAPPAMSAGDADSVNNDYSAELDSIFYDVHAPDSAFTGYIKVCWSSSGYPDSAVADSAHFTYSHATFTDTIPAWNGTETYTLYFSAWAVDTDEDCWSVRHTWNQSFTGEQSTGIYLNLGK